MTIAVSGGLDVRWLWFGAFDERLASPQDVVGMLACVDIRSHERLVPFAVAQAEHPFGARALHKGAFAGHATLEMLLPAVLHTKCALAPLQN